MRNGLAVADYVPKVKKFFGRTDFHITGRAKETMKNGETLLDSKLSLMGKFFLVIRQTKF